ncbi:ribonuclease R [Holdemania massiliensis]
MEQTDIKQQIETMIADEQYRPLSLAQLQETLGLSTTEEFIAMNKAVNELAEQYVIVFSQKGNLMPAKMGGYYRGVLSVNRKGFGFLDLENENSIHITEANLHGAMNGDLAIVKKLPSFYGSDEGEVIRVLQHKTNTLVGTFFNSVGKGLQLKLDDERIKARLIVKNWQAFKMVSGTKALLKVLRYGDPMELEIVQLLGHIDDPGVDILSVLLEYDIDPQFPEEVMEQAQKTPARVTPKDKEGRRDCTAKTIITIDGEDSKDLDDAVCVEKIDGGYRLGVHIADVSHYVPENSPLDLEALKRGTSTYVVDRVVPMLPHLLSNGICSLNPKVLRLTLSCEMEISESGEILNYEIFPSYIKTTERMTYTAVNAILEGEEETCRKYKKLVNMIGLMRDCSRAIRQRRHAAGAIDFETPEAKIILNPQGKIEEIQVRERKEAEMLIEDFMVCANECVARHLKWLEVPALYRVHEAPEPKKLRDFAKIVLLMGKRFKGSVEQIRPLQLQQLLDSFKEDPAYPVISTMMLRSMQKAKYDPRCLGHFGLALEEYTHFTSPIRRYPDLIVHRMLHKYCFGLAFDPEVMKQDELKMEEYGKLTSERERAAIEAEREVEDMKKAEYMEDQVGKIAEGVISGVTKFGFFVELENTVEGLVHVQKLTDDYYHYDPDTLSLKGERTKKIYRLGQRVKIKVTGASKLHQEIDFDLVRPRKEKREAVVPAAKKTGYRKDSSRPAESIPVKNKRRRSHRRKPKPTQA